MNPSQEHNVLEDLNQLDKALTADTTGDCARSLIRYFDDALATSQALLQQNQPAEERQLTGQLIEGFHAAKRIVSHVWESLHSAPLNT